MRALQKQGSVTFFICLEELLPVSRSHRRIAKLHDHGQLGLEVLGRFLQPARHFGINLRVESNDQ